MWGQKKLRNIVVECRNILVAHSSYGIGFVKSYLLHRLAPSSNIFGQRSVTAVQSTLFSRWGDLVFFQNGIMESWLESKGLEDANRCWLILLCPKLEKPLLMVLDKEVFQKQMLEKLIWICSVMLVGAPHGGVSVGVMDKEFRSELSSLITELESAASSEKGLTFEEAMEECLCAYSRAIAHFPTVVKEISKHGIFLSYCAIWEISEISDHGIFLTPLFEPFVIPLLLEKLSSSLHSAKGFSIDSLEYFQLKEAKVL
ncbi:hypothetical protein JHK82_048416 [Glycine max]|nr:hypothetical protein JHK82_048416 [Glycine max]